MVLKETLAKKNISSRFTKTRLSLGKNVSPPQFQPPFSRKMTQVVTDNQSLQRELLARKCEQSQGGLGIKKVNFKKVKATGQNYF